MRARWPTYLVIFTATAAISVVTAQAVRTAQARREVGRLKRALEMQQAAQPSVPVSNPANDSENSNDEDLRAEFRRQISELQAKNDDLVVRLVSHSRPVPETNWKNAGRDSAGAVLETALWASKGGDVSALADTLAMSEYGTAKAGRHFHKLQKAERDAFGSAARMVAALASSEIPDERAQVTILDPNSNQTEARVEYIDGAVTKTVTLTLQRKADGWRISVPEHVIDRYGQLLGERLDP